MDINSLIESVRKVLREAREKLTRLSSTERDRRAIKIGAAGLCLLILYLFLHSFTSGAERLEKRAIQLHADLARIENLRDEYRNSKERIIEISSRIKEEGEPLISVVEQILVDENIERKNFSIKDMNLRTSASEDFYEERSVDVELKNLSLNNLVDILYKIQNAQSFLKVSNLNISTKFDKSDSMTVKLRVSTFEFKEVS
ncbi:MAG: hypothetical protein RIG61_12720 [Deltaproteobacteria bacterium]